MRKGESIEKSGELAEMNEKEVILVRMMYEFPDVLQEASRTLNPSLVANFLYELAKEFNQFYHDHSILGGGSPALVILRLRLVEAIGHIIRNGMELLGIEMPERM